MKPIIFLAFANDKEPYKLHIRPNLSVENTKLSKILKEKNIPFEVLPSFNKDDFKKILAENGRELQVFHYGGHGETDSLFFENFDTNERANAKHLLNYLAGYGLKLIFLNACDTYPVVANLLAEQEKTENQFAATVICAKGKIDDAVAIQFSETFYLHLANGYSVRDSFEKAKEAQKISDNKSKSPNDWHLLGTDERKNWKLGNKLTDLGQNNHSTNMDLESFKKELLELVDAQKYNEVFAKIKQSDYEYTKHTLNRLQGQFGFQITFDLISQFKVFIGTLEEKK